MEQEFEEIYRLYARDVYRFLLKMCGNQVLAEDILQDTMLKAITAIDRFDGRCSVKSWLCTIARREYLNHLKKAETKSVPLEEAALDGTALGRAAAAEKPESAVVSRISAIELLRLVHRLDETQKEIFMLRVYGELKFSEIGSVFGKSENWARVSFFRAKARLAEMAEKEDLI